MTVYCYARVDYPTNMLEQFTTFSKIKYKELIIERRDIRDFTEFQRMCEKLQKGDTLVVIKLSVLWSSPNIREWLNMFEELDIRIISLMEEIDTAAEPSFYSQANLFLQVTHDVRSLQVKVAIGRARDLGHELGRPRLDSELIDQIIALRKNQYSFRQISEELNVSLGSIHKYLKAGPVKVQSGE